jgi:hypothetical protein
VPPREARSLTPKGDSGLKGETLTLNAFDQGFDLSGDIAQALHFYRCPQHSVVVLPPTGIARVDDPQDSVVRHRCSRRASGQGFFQQRSNHSELLTHLDGVVSLPVKLRLDLSGPNQLLVQLPPSLVELVSHGERM